MDEFIVFVFIFLFFAVDRIINAPTTSDVITNELDKKKKKKREKNILIYDIGSDIFDISVQTIANSVFNRFIPFLI